MTLRTFERMTHPLSAESIRDVRAHLAEVVEHAGLDDVAAVIYIGYIHEAALRMQFGGRKVTRTQLDHLQVMSERDNITLRIIPVSCDGFPGAGHALLYAEGPVPQLDTVQLDSTHGPEFLHADAQLAKFRAHLDWMDAHSLSPEASRDLIHSVAREL
ncbi:Scr1 family TA system antitoxin-like transcriptional regulator [Streptomyces sp. NPDC000987]|uniref:Scr1 family TA system antitoxin-like transcriptional regulator n=1 Tax=Streptomyces sp. NPDC000987 TaxID=3154374 RepID=UPI0033279FB3